MTDISEATARPMTSIEREVRIAAPPEAVFAFWTDPERIVRWMGRVATLEPRPGGAFRLDYNGSDIARGEVLEIDPPRRLVISWGWEAPGDATPPGASIVEVDLAPDSSGGTVLRLSHRGLTDEAVQGHSEGWDQFLAALVNVAGASRS
jgi:uncharacterized protein YndB with AHSA1/START domain